MVIIFLLGGNKRFVNKLLPRCSKPYITEMKPEKKEERRSKKRKSQKNEDAGARKGRKVAKQCVFPIFTQRRVYIEGTISQSKHLHREAATHAAPESAAKASFATFMQPLEIL